MHKLIPLAAAFMIALGTSQPAGAESGKTETAKIETAIDATALVEGGASDAEIIRQLSEQRGMTPGSATLRGKSEPRQILSLLDLPEPSQKDADKGKTAAHRTAGEDLFKKGDFAKAAWEFTQATRYAADNLDIYKYELYKMRGDSYKEFLKTRLNPLTPSGKEEAKKPFFDKKREMVCGAVYADYRKASDLLDRSIQTGITEIEARNVRMKELKEGKDPTRQHKSKSGEYINIMRDMRRILYRQASARSGVKHLKEAMDDYRTVCSAEEKARRDQAREARDKARDKNWIKFGEIDDARYFYDKDAVKKAKNRVTAWFRKETLDDEASYELTGIRLDCGKKTYATLEISSYGEDGKLKAKQQFKKAAEKKVVRDKPEAMLLGRVCK